MKLADVLPIIGEVPHMSKNEGSLIYNMILANDIFEILELGTAHGTGSCYMAAALEEKGRGSVLTIDNKTALLRVPNVFDLIKKCNIEKYVTPVFANSSYNWELMKIIDRQTKNGFCEPVYDLCFIDGAHNFEIDCCAFTLVDKLVKPGGFILFDDLNWTYAKSPSMKDTNFVKQMAEDEKTTPQIRKLVELIVVNYDNYSDFSILESWFLTRKKSGTVENKNKNVRLDMYKAETTLVNDFKQLVKKTKNRIFATKVRVA
jgi:predicted O-methyltransferase YrrM